MSERYSKLCSLPENLYADGAPVIVEAGNLLKDNQTDKVLVQLKIKNICGKTVKAATVIVHAQDTTGKRIDGDVTKEYLDLAVKQGEEFGQKTAIKLPDASTRGLSVEVKRVVFADGSIWETIGNAWEPLPAKKSLSRCFNDLELVKQYQIQFGGKCDFAPQEYKDLWLCACGEWNKDDKCCCCGKTKSPQLSYDCSVLKAEKETRLAKEKAERETKEAAMQLKAKKTKTLLAILIPSVVICVAALLIITKIVIPNADYNKAMELFSAGQYKEAIAAFEALDGYKDSDAQAAAAREAKVKADRLAREAKIEAENSSKYEQASNALSAGKYLEAISGFSALGNYRDSAQRIIIALDDAFQCAESLVEDGEYEEAIALYQGLEQYYSEKESRYTEIANGIAYTNAKKMYLSGQYTSAYRGFKALAGYKDSDTILNTDRNMIKVREDLIRPFKTVGNTVLFGSYEQDNRDSNGDEPIEWIVLDVQDGKSLLLSKKNLIRQDHYFSLGFPSNNFYIFAFDKTEEKAILSTEISYEYDGEIKTKTLFVFSLSAEEVERYLPDPKDRVCDTTKRAYYSKENKYDTTYGMPATKITYYSGDTYSWWLRSPSGQHQGSYVSADGEICTTKVRCKSLFVRPAMWVDLEELGKML